MNVFIGLTGFVYLCTIATTYVFTYGVVHVVLATGLSLSLSLSLSRLPTGILSSPKKESYFVPTTTTCPIILFFG
jgi:hypothetical protein